MKKIYYLLLVLTILGCTGDFPSPSTDSTELKGNYRTNGLLDFSCVAITDERQLPTLSVTKEAGGTYRLTRTDFIPSKRTTAVSGVRVEAKNDSLLLFRGSTKIGNLAAGTMRVVKGKKTQEVVAPLLLVSVNDTISKTFLFYFGYRE